MGLPRLLIAGTHSGVGKTTISTGIMAALAARGLTVQGFKVGPDYIDPGYHTMATGRVSRNLDTWLLGDNLLPLFEQAAQGADIAVVEGVMGLFDGIKGQKDRGSCAHVAELIEAPVVLLVDARSMAYSAAAVVHGFATFKPGVKVAGVILNRIGSPSHLSMVKEAVESTGIPVVGYLGKDEGFSLQERHLGLVPVAEKEFGQDYFTRLVDKVEAGIDLDLLLEIANQHQGSRRHRVRKAKQVDRSRVKLALARDEAFNFYYQDALDTLVSLGAEIIPFSPLHDLELPPGVQGIFIGGGFPESFLPQLAANKTMHRSLQEAHAAGLPIYAECGGLMYLCREITGFAGEKYCGVGLVPAVTGMSKRLQGMGYRKGIMEQDTLLGPAGTAAFGHEFHYSSTDYTSFSNAYRLSTAIDEDKGLEGYADGNLLASYLHLNFAGNPALAENFLQACRYMQGAKKTWALR